MRLWAVITITDRSRIDSASHEEHDGKHHPRLRISERLGEEAWLAGAAGLYREGLVPLRRARRSARNATRSVVEVLRQGPIDRGQLGPR